MSLLNQKPVHCKRKSVNTSSYWNNDCSFFKRWYSWRRTWKKHWRLLVGRPSFHVIPPTSEWRHHKTSYCLRLYNRLPGNVLLWKIFLWRISQMYPEKVTCHHQNWVQVRFVTFLFKLIFGSPVPPHQSNDLLETKIYMSVISNICPIVIWIDVLWRNWQLWRKIRKKIKEKIMLMTRKLPWKLLDLRL